jgi:hypothetical protein
MWRIGVNSPSNEEQHNTTQHNIQTISKNKTWSLIITTTLSFISFSYTYNTTTVQDTVAAAFTTTLLFNFSWHGPLEPIQYYTILQTQSIHTHTHLICYLALFLFYFYIPHSLLYTSFPSLPSFFFQTKKLYTV